MEYTTESVLKGHPDKVCDQISDAILDAYLRINPDTRTAIECLGSGNTLIVAGEISDNTEYIDIEKVITDTYNTIGYNNNLNIVNLLERQSYQLSNAIRQGAAGDQGVVYGYGINNDYNYLPYGNYIANLIAQKIDIYRNNCDYLLPDGKIQVKFDDNNLIQLTINVQHKPETPIEHIEHDIMQNVISDLIDRRNVDIQINRNSKFFNGGFSNDTGLTGRKLMVDTYGGLVIHGGGAFSGKDPTKIDRSGAYMARFVAKNIVANGLEKECMIGLAYMFGVERPTMISVSTDKNKNNRALKEFIMSKFDFRPNAIIEQLELKAPIYTPTSIYGHFQNPSYNWEKIISL